MGEVGSSRTSCAKAKLAYLSAPGPGEDAKKCCTTCKNPISEVAIRDIQSGFYRAGIGERPLKLHPTT
jgi:hypothetical protein